MPDPTPEQLARSLENRRQLSIQMRKDFLEKIETCESRLRNGMRPRSAADPILKFSHEGVQRERDEWIERLRVHDEKHQKKFGESITSPSPPPMADPREEELRQLREQNGRLMHRIEELTGAIAALK